MEIEDSFDGSKKKEINLATIGEFWFKTKPSFDFF